MAALPYMQLYVADYLADTAHLSTLENGAYLLLIFNYWQRGESFKAKDQQSLNKRLASVARLSNEEWENVKESLAEFFETSETEWKHSRIDRDLDSVNAKSAKASAAGKASAASKANNRSTNAEQTFNHTDTDTDTDTDISTTTVVDKSVHSEVAQVFEHWKSVMDSPRSNLDKKRKTAIEARLKDGFSVDDLKSAIDGCRKTPHNMGDNDRGQKFNDIELICRNAPNVERFMNATGASPPKPKAVRPLTAAERYVAQDLALKEARRAKELAIEGEVIHAS